MPGRPRSSTTRSGRSPRTLASAGGAVADDRHLEPGHLEVVAQGARDLHLVLDDQDPLHGCEPLARRGAEATASAPARRRRQPGRRRRRGGVSPCCVAVPLPARSSNRRRPSSFHGPGPWPSARGPSVRLRG